MRFTRQTSEIVDVIRNTLRGLGLLDRVETPFHSNDGASFCDVTGRVLPDGNPVFHFEIDQEPRGVLWNNFGKYFGRLGDIERLRAIRFAVLWNKAVSFQTGLHRY